jgi:antirestriction protein ArdC
MKKNSLTIKKRFMESNNSTSMKLDVYSIVTERIISILEQGTIPWVKPWAEAGVPKNLISKRAYRGINLWLLLSLNYARNLFLTFDQLKKIGGSVKQGEHGHVVVFWKTIEASENGSGDGVGDAGGAGGARTRKTFLRYYKVFNIEQCTGVPEKLLPENAASDLSSLTECEAIVETMPACPAIKFKDGMAYYNIAEDFINMPKKKNFASMEGYYATLFHELVHATGHEKRLNRPTLAEMAERGSENYSIEELVAELGTAYLCSWTGILHKEIKNSAAYIAGWLKPLKNDKRFIIRAAGDAQKAVDYILNLRAAGSGSAEESAVEGEEVATEQ